MRAQRFTCSTHNEFRSKADIIFEPSAGRPLDKHGRGHCQDAQAQHKADEEFHRLAHDDNHLSTPLYMRQRKSATFCSCSSNTSALSVIVSSRHLSSAPGEVVWCCLPRFDSEPVFSTLLDAKQGGKFLVGPADGQCGKQSYIENTNILKTTFETPSGSFRVVDFAPRFVQYDRTFPANTVVPNSRAD